VKLEKIKSFFAKYKYGAILSLLMVLAFVFRFKGLTLQGLWYDELYSVVLSSKHPLWKIIAECASDVHPPFFQICIYLWFKIFPATEFLSRLYPLTTGMAGLFLMYLLGKELYDKLTGTIALSFGAVNFFLIYYSQEVRSYSQSFALTVLSTLLLVKLLKNPTVLKAISYGLITLMLMYSHYFGIVIGASQAVFVLFYLIIVKVKSVKDFLKLSISGVIVVVGYLFWVPVMLNQMKIKDFWIKPVKNWFFVDYIINYFVNTPIAIGFSILFVLSAVYFFIEIDKNKESNEGKWSIRISTALTFSIVFFSYLIPYLKSLESSVLTPRNTIVTLPFILIGAAAGANFIKFKKLKITIVVLLVLACGFVTLKDSNGYLTKQKEKWREAVKFVIDNATPNKSIVLSESNYKQYSYFQYYFDHFGSDFKVLHPSKYQFLKLLADNNFNLEVWTLEGHWKPEVSKENLKILKAFFKIVEKHESKTVKARKYVLRNKESLKFIRQMLNEEGSLTQRAQRGDAKSAKETLDNKITEDSTSSIQHSLAFSESTFFPAHLDSKRTYKVGYRFVVGNIGKLEVIWRMLDKKTGKVVDSDKVADFFGLDEDTLVDNKWISFDYQKVSKEKKLYILEGELPKASLFLTIPNNFVLEFKKKNNENRIKVEVSDTPENDKLITKIQLLKNYSTQKILLFSKLPISLKRNENNSFYSFEKTIAHLSATPDTDSLVKLIYKKDFKYLLINNLINKNLLWHLRRMKKLKGLLKLVANSDDFTLYEINSLQSISFTKFDKEIFKWTKDNDTNVLSYFNKKRKTNIGRFLYLTDGVITIGLKEKSFWITAFANGKLWKKKSGYIDVSEGFLRFSLKGKSLGNSVTVSPLITMYDKDGDVISTYNGEKLVITEEKKYDFAFGIKYYKTTSPYLEIPKNCKKIAIALYFYKEKGALFVEELKVLKGNIL